MKPRAYSIPFYQPLPPLQFLARPGDLEKHFPFSAPDIHHYYLARNAIWHGLDSLGLSAGDSILMPAYHHGVEVQVLQARGMRIVYYSMDEEMRIDFEDLRRVSAATPEAKALYVIHCLGFPQDVDAVDAFVRDRGLLQIEDCALALFTEVPRGPVGTFGDISIFCLYKTLPLPHGGTLVRNRPGLAAPPGTNRPDFLSSLAMIGNRTLDYVGLQFGGPGQRAASWGRDLARSTKRGLRAAPVPIDTNTLDTSTVDLGMGASARYLLARTRASEVVRIRRRNFEHLASRLNDTLRPVFRALPEGVCPLSYPVLTRDPDGARLSLLEDGVETVNFWAQRQPEIPVGRFPTVDSLRGHVLEIPVHQGIEPKHAEFIAERAADRARW
jgi:hypothetical protein